MSAEISTTAPVAPNIEAVREAIKAVDRKPTTSQSLVWRAASAFIKHRDFTMRLIVQKYGGTSVGDTADEFAMWRDALWKRNATVAASSQSFQPWPA